eukprot:Em0023g310a
MKTRSMTMTTLTGVHMKTSQRRPQATRGSCSSGRATEHFRWGNTSSPRPRRLKPKKQTPLPLEKFRLLPLQGTPGYQQKKKLDACFPN